MKKYLIEIIILLIQFFMFYIYPLFSGPTDAMGLVFILILSTFILSLIITIISKYKYLYGTVISLLFVPTVFVYYNSSALIHSLWYLVVSYIGTFIGIIFNLIFKK